jgi:hypothetical protein
MDVGYALCPIVTDPVTARRALHSFGRLATTMPPSLNGCLLLYS